MLSGHEHRKLKQSEEAINNKLILKRKKIKYLLEEKVKKPAEMYIECWLLSYHE